MNRFVKWWTLSLVALAALVAAPAMAQTAKDRAAKGPYRPPSKGVMEDVSPARQFNESYSRHDVIELLAVDPKFDWAKNVTFRRDVWNLKFEYKPLRMVWVDVPQESGKLQRKPIHYLVYSVTNESVKEQKSKPPRYGWMHPVKNEDGTYSAEYQDRPIPFVPAFLLNSPEYNKAYPDRVIPLAMPAIRAREDRLLPAWADASQTIPREPLRNSVEMAMEIPVGQTAWGVATWEEVDPRIDRFTIYVQGLTNVYQWKDDPAKYRADAPREEYRKLALKTLRLNFWRPGDEFDPHEGELRRGHPGEPDYDWLYLPSLGGK